MRRVLVPALVLVLLGGCDLDPPDDSARVGEPIELHQPGESLELYRANGTLGRSWLVPSAETGDVVGLAFLGGSNLAIGGDGGGLEVWALGAGQRRQVGARGPRLVELATDAGGSILVVATVGGRPRLFGPAGSVLLDEAGPGRSPIWRVAVDPQGRWAATAADDAGRVSMWALPEGKARGEIALAATDVAALALTGSLVAAAGAGGEVEVCEIETGATVDRFEIGGRPVGLAFSPDGRFLAAASRPGLVQIREPRRAVDRATRQEGEGSVRAIAWTAGGELVLGLSDGRVLLPEGERLVARLPGPVRALATSSDPPLLAAATAEVVRVLHQETRLEVGPTGVHRAGVTGLVFDDEARVLTSAGVDGAILAWPLDEEGEGAEVLRIDSALSGLAAGSRGLVAATRSTLLFVDLDGHVWNRKNESAAIGAFAVDPASGRIAQAAGALVRLREPAGQDTGLELGPHGGNVRAVEFGREGLLVSGDARGLVHFWDLHSESYLGFARAHGAPVVSLAADPGGAWIASAAIGEPIRIWDAPRRTLRREAGPVAGGPLAARPDGRLVAWAGQEEGIHLVDPAGGVRWRSLPTDGARCRSLRFSPDGRRLAAGLEDGTIRIYSIVVAE